jgi:choline dehydrogenase-like flavoprotein
VLATGGLEVPRLLLASNTQHPNGIGNEYDLVGRHFMEHVNIAAGVALLTTDTDGLAPYLPSDHTVTVNEEEREVSIQAVILIAEDLQRSFALRSCEVTIEFPFPIGSRKLDRLFPGVHRGVALMRAGGLEPGIGPVLRVLCEQEPNPASRVTLTRTRDQLGIPRIQLDWQLTRDDRLSMLRTIDYLGTEVARRGLGRIRLDIDGYRELEPSPSDPLAYPVNTGSHHMGTARMQASPRLGVVDADCKVHSVKNLYIGGSAVFPTSGANTPTLTIVALAVRLSDHIRTELT